jgi:hypothetical protein
MSASILKHFLVRRWLHCVCLVVPALLLLGMLTPVLTCARLVSDGCGCGEQCPCRMVTKRCSCSKRNGLTLGARCDCGTGADAEAPPASSWLWRLATGSGLPLPEVLGPLQHFEPLTAGWLLPYERAHPS